MNAEGEPAEADATHADDRQAEIEALTGHHESEIAARQAEIGQLKEEVARLNTANETLAREKAQSSEEAGALKGEVARLKDGLAALRDEIDTAATETAKQAANVATMSRELSALEEAMSRGSDRYEAAREKLAALEGAPAPAMPAPVIDEKEDAPAPESEPVQALEPYTAEEQDADARTLAEVKASLLAELDAPRDTAAPEDEDEEGPPEPEEPRNAGPSLAERIRALEQGVAH